MASYAEQRKQFIFIWKIENFNFNGMDIGESIMSPTFVLQEFHNTAWCLEFYPRGHENCEGYSSCYLWRTHLGVEEICIAYKIELLNDDGKCLISRKRNNSIFEKRIYKGWEKYLNYIRISNLSTITIRCFLSFLGTETKLIGKCRVRTKIGFDRHFFQWNVKIFNDSSWTESKIFCYSSTVSIEITLTEMKDTMNVCVKKVMEGFADQVSFYMECKLSILDVNGVEQDSSRYEHFFDSDHENDTWEFLSFITKNELITEKDKFIKDGTFTLKFEFYISNGYVADEIFYEEHDCKDGFDQVERVAINQKHTMTALQKDLLQMYTTHLKFDVNLRAENQTFKAHKSHLSARSPVFAAMFEQDMLENKTGVVNIPDIEAKILNCFLEYLYTGIVNNLDYENTSKLMIVADKYQVSSLMEKCSSFLMSNLTIENACDVVMLADMVGHSALKAFTVDYIMTQAETILSSDHWTQCVKSNVKLATDIICKLSNKLCFKCKTGE